MSTANVTSIFTTYTSNIGTNLANNLPLVLAIVAGLIGLGILVRYVKRWIGRK